LYTYFGAAKVSLYTSGNWIEVKVSTMLQNACLEACFCMDRTTSPPYVDI